MEGRCGSRIGYRTVHFSDFSFQFYLFALVFKFSSIHRVRFVVRRLSVSSVRVSHTHAAHPIHSVRQGRGSERPCRILVTRSENRRWTPIFLSNSLLATTAPPPSSSDNVVAVVGLSCWFGSVVVVSSRAFFKWVHMCVLCTFPLYPFADVCPSVELVAYWTHEDCRSADQWSA